MRETTTPATTKPLPGDPHQKAGCEAEQRVRRGQVLAMLWAMAQSQDLNAWLSTRWGQAAPPAVRAVVLRAAREHTEDAAWSLYLLGGLAAAW